MRIGVPEKRELLGERSELCEAQETRGSKFTAPFRRQIWSILSQVRAKNIRVTQENNMTGSHKKQRYYEPVHRTVSQTVDKVAKPCRAIKRNSIRGPRQIENLVGKRRKERSVYYEFQRNSFKHGISFDVS